MDNMCNCCENQDTHLCQECFVYGGRQTYPWFKEKEEED